MSFEATSNAGRFRQCLELLKWQGGTIHQVNNELTRKLDRKISIYHVTVESWDNLINELKQRLEK